MSRIEDEDRYWKLFRIKDKINWIRRELGYEPIRFVRGTNTIIVDELMKEEPVLDKGGNSSIGSSGKSSCLPDLGIYYQSKKVNVKSSLVLTLLGYPPC